MKYFVALQYPGNGSLGFEVYANSEEDAKNYVLSTLPQELKEDGFLKAIVVVPENRINVVVVPEN